MSTVMAFDFGLKRIGVAVGNRLMKQAQPLALIEAATNVEKFTAIGGLINEWQPDTIVVGLPLHPDGAEHEMSVRCRRFAHQITGRFGLPTVLVDERYTSAVLTASRGEYVDSQAAALILQQFFDAHESH
jgi:putative Holliday junction resolvase